MSSSSFTQFFRRMQKMRNVICILKWCRSLHFNNEKWQLSTVRWNMLRRMDNQIWRIPVWAGFFRCLSTKAAIDAMLKYCIISKYTHYRLFCPFFILRIPWKDETLFTDIAGLRVHEMQCRTQRAPAKYPQRSARAAEPGEKEEWFRFVFVLLFSLISEPSQERIDLSCVWYFH